MKKETLISISQRSGYSISTVSRVLSGQAEKYRISKKTIDLITKEAQTCNYKPSLLAKGLRTNKTNTIGLIIPSIENHYFAHIASVIINESKQHNYKVLMVDSGENEYYEREEIMALLSRKVDGIIVVPCGQKSEELERINIDTPIILIDRYFTETTLPYVCTDNYIGAMNATKYLIECGHKSIVCIQGTPHSTTVKERTKGYIDAMTAYKLKENITICGESFSIQNGYLETKLLLGNKSRPTAIFTLSNMILLGAMKAIREAGLTIPDDISVVSFDNNTYLEYMNPAITCVNQPTEEIGTLAVKLIINNINNKSSRIDSQILLPPNLTIRNSIAVINQKK